MTITETILNFTGLSDRRSTTRIILHHVAGTMTVQSIHSMHTGYGWGGIGYHFLVDKDGKVYRGRPIARIGAHASSDNIDSVGICFNGNFETETMSTAQINAGKAIVAYVKNYYGITRVQKHSDVSATACPGKNFPFSTIAGATSGSTTELYRVRKTWADAASQIGAFSSLESAKSLCNKNTGYSVFNSAGIKVYPTSTFVSYVVRVITDVLNIRSGPGTGYSTVGTVTRNQAFTITQQSNGFGYLKSGAGWISLEYIQRV